MINQNIGVRRESCAAQATAILPKAEVLREGD
ncbi:hypothetical protein JOD24_002341 [Kroppenstedtia sanguinis]